MPGGSVKSRKSQQKQGEESPKPEVHTGELIFGNGDIYEGDYEVLQKVMQRCGFGKYSHSDGTVYEGHWENDQLHGQGVIQYTDGSVYKGGIKGKAYEGVGVYTFPDGTTISGTFSNGRLQGRTEFSDEDGQKWIGETEGNESSLQLKLR